MLKARLTTGVIVFVGVVYALILCFLSLIFVLAFRAKFRKVVNGMMSFVSVSSSPLSSFVAYSQSNCYAVTDMGGQSR